MEISKLQLTGIIAATILGTLLSLWITAEALWQNYWGHTTTIFQEIERHYHESNRQ